MTKTLPNTLSIPAVTRFGASEEVLEASLVELPRAQHRMYADQGVIIPGASSAGSVTVWRTTSESWTQDDTDNRDTLTSWSPIIQPHRPVSAPQGAPLTLRGFTHNLDLRLAVVQVSTLAVIAELVVPGSATFGLHEATLDLTFSEAFSLGALRLYLEGRWTGGGSQGELYDWHVRAQRLTNPLRLPGV